MSSILDVTSNQLLILLQEIFFLVTLTLFFEVFNPFMMIVITSNITSVLQQNQFPFLSRQATTHENEAGWKIENGFYWKIGKNAFIIIFLTLREGRGVDVQIANDDMLLLVFHQIWCYECEQMFSVKLIGIGVRTRFKLGQSFSGKIMQLF